MDATRLEPRLGEPARRPTVIVGAEISTEAGHVLAIGIRPPAFRFSGTLREVLDDVRHLGGCAFAAHPASARGETRFTREGEPGVFGVEVVNGDSAWREASVPRLAWAAFTYLPGSRYALTNTLGEYREELALWDRMLTTRFVPAIGGADAHARIPLGRTAAVAIPSYEALFGVVRTVALIDGPMAQDGLGRRRQIVDALCAGRSLVATSSLADPTAFTFEARAGGVRVGGPGDAVEYRAGLELRARAGSPRGAALRLVRDGGEAALANDELRFAVVSPGVYRIEARIAGWTTPWVLTNPIEIFDRAALARRRADPRIAALASASPTTPGETIDAFDAPATTFAPENDPRSSVGAPVIDPEGGRNRSAAARLRFALSPGPETPAWTALVSRRPLDLSSSSGLSFWARADGEYRVWVQLRDRNPSSPDEGTEAWFASIRTATTWTRYEIPFSSLRSILPVSDGSFDPKSVQQIVFVIDHGAMPLGSSGTIWIDDLETVRTVRR